MSTAVHQSIADWYRQNGRHSLPWRLTDDPYKIYISEVMLQQTQVKTVLERFYSPFLKKFPSLTVLANAAQEDVLKAWQGLGYYNRAINLHKAAKQTAPALPADMESLIALPGIGRNTAHAILAFGFHQAVPILEANVKRILYRFYALEEAGESQLWQYAQTLLDRKNSFDYNQAMMDIGALICTKTTPQCTVCPLALKCKGKSNPAAYPKPKKKKQTPVRKRHIILFENQKGEYFLRPRQTRFLNNLYQFVESEDVRVEFQGQHYELHTPIGHVSQTYSHFQLDAKIYKITTNYASGNDWYSPKAIKALPLSKAEEKILAFLTA